MSVRTGAAQIEGVHRQLVAAVAALAWDSLGPEALAGVVATLREVQRTADAAVVRAALRADQLAAGGDGPPARDVLLGSGQVRGATARREAARAALARRSPELGRAIASGRLGPDHVDALVRRIGPLSGERLDRTELAAVLDAGRDLPADTFDAALRRAVEAGEPAPDDGEPAEGEPDENERLRAASEVRHWFDHRTGKGHLTATLDAERYEAVANALDQHVASLAQSWGAEKSSALAASALVDLVCSSGARRPHLPHLTVVADQRTLRGCRHADSIAETGDGHALADPTLARLACDAVLRRVVLGRDGAPIDVGRQHRTATPAQWSALRAVHRGCAWVGCDRPLSHCQAHHIRHWRHGGSTDLDNLVPLCGHHHHLVHEGRWHIELLADRALRITRPDGQHHVTTNAPTRRPPPLPTPLDRTAP